MKNILHRIIYALYSFINIFVPKQNKIMVYGGAFLNGNTEALFRYLCVVAKVPIVCVAKKHLMYESTNCIYISEDNVLRVIWNMLSCSVLIDSSEHRIKMKPTKRQMFVQLWHGSPLKFLTQPKWIKYGDYYSKICYGSELFKEILQKNEFNTSSNKMFLNGNPHNDYLFNSVKNIDPSFVGKKIMWLPTYRHWGNVVHSTNDIPIINKENVNQLNDFLKSVNVKIYLKPHPLQTIGFERVMSRELSNIALISDEDLVNEGVTLYEFLAKMDALLTDYSSVMFDFLLINRPIGFTIDDYEEYAKNVGFGLDDPLSLMAGMILNNIEDLTIFIQNLVDGKDDYVQRRVDVNALVNYYKDGNNCKRIFDMIKPYLD